MPDSANRQIVVGLAVLALGVVVACGPMVDPADLVLQNGKVVTVDDDNPEAQAVAVRGDSIVAVGTNDQIAAYVGPDTEVIDLDGQLATPGFIEGHGHFMSIGNAAMQLRLMNTQSWDEIVSLVAEAVENAEPGEWIFGRGWHQEKWTSIPEASVAGFPVHEALSAVSPDNPVSLGHASGHARFVNAKALELSDITRDTPDPDGGEILKDARGNPTGLLNETAQRLVRSPRGNDPDLMRRQATLAAQEAISKGITSFQDAGSGFATVDLLKEMAEAGELPVRLWIMLRGSNDDFREKLDAYRMVGAANNHLTVRAIKHSIDGALGSRGAWMLEPYSDMAETSGLNTTPVETIAETAALAAAHGYQLCVHAIGDRGNRESLDIFEAVYAEHPEIELRFRIEHAQHLHPDDIPRFGQLGVIASMEGIHCTSDAPYVVARLGEQRAEEGAYVWQKLMQSGAIVSNGTDAPVEDVDPIASYYATVSRKAKDGSVFYPDQRMSREEALKSYTWNAAYAAFEEELKGSLEVGKLADLVVLSQDILTVPEDEIPSTEIVYTIVGGKIVYQRGQEMTSAQ